MLLLWLWLKQTATANSQVVDLTGPRNSKSGTFCSCNKGSRVHMHLPQVQRCCCAEDAGCFAATQIFEEKADREGTSMFMLRGLADRTFGTSVLGDGRITPFQGRKSIDDFQICCSEQGQLLLAVEQACREMDASCPSILHALFQGKEVQRVPGFCNISNPHQSQKCRSHKVQFSMMTEMTHAIVWMTHGKHDHATQNSCSLTGAEH
jgi:hypothetical protein